jgi:hypothetical protein
MKPWVKIASGISLSAGIIGFIVAWDTVIKENIDSEEVVIVKPGMEIGPHEPITEDKIMVEKRDRSTLVEGAVRSSELSEIIGYETKSTLIGNEIITKREIDFERLVPDPQKGEAVRPIPNEWIYAKPSTLRRKDLIDIYLFPSEKLKDGSAVTSNPPSVNGSAQNPKGTTPSNAVANDVILYNGLSPEQKARLKEIMEEHEKEQQQYAAERNEIAAMKKVEEPKEAPVNQKVMGQKEERILDQDKVRTRIMQELGMGQQEWAQLVQQGDIPILVDIPVLYAKDNAGNEITDQAPDEKKSPSENEKRLYASGTITNLEVLMDEDEYRLLKDYIEKGYLLYITYN